ncbi:hypothetical protein HZH66_012055 [Vespula vulgaris]|uniref:Uncharacterized protein n=1 Tax=Vespula vulgaris TaxID=7454 RepID=A0A834JAT0_VESVU|nr:hypothetical protein HZH66_012055 [Vespula vulgaris]
MDGSFSTRGTIFTRKFCYSETFRIARWQVFRNVRKGKAEDRNKEIFDQEFHALCVFRPARYAKIVQYYLCPFKVSRDLGEYRKFKLL